MFSNRFRKGMHVNFGGREYVIKERLPDGNIRLRDIAFDESVSKAPDELLDALFAGQLEFLGDGSTATSTQREMVKSFVDDITMVESTDPRKIEFRRRLLYVEQIQVADLTAFNATTLEPIIERVHRENKDPNNKPCWRTVYYGWFVPFINFGILALVPLYKRRGNRTRKFTGRPNQKGQKFTQTERRKAEEVKVVIDEVINEEFMDEQRISVAELCDRVEQRIASINKFRDANDHLPFPHPDSIYDIISKMDEYEKDKARYGKLFAEQKHEQRKQGPRPTRPLERVEIDHTTLDLFIIDEETRLPVGRPTITVIIDKYSRMIVGVHVGFDPPGYLSVMLCLLHAITPKRYVEADFPRVENRWNTYGIPEQIIVDNAREFYSEDFDDACRQLGILPSYSPVRHPWFKASVERFFGTQNRRLLHNQPGTTFSNVIAKGDYDPKKNSLISFSAFMEILHIWIVDVYSQEYHRGLGDIPAHVWENGINEFPPNLPRRKQELRVLVGQVEKRKISRSGIKLYNLTFNDDRLALLRRELRGKKAKLKVNPDDLSIIYVNNPKDDSYIPVLADDQEYTKGLSLWQHEVIQRYVRKVIRSRIDRDSLRRAKQKIQAIVDREWLQSHKATTRVKMARWRRIHQHTYGVAQEVPEDRANAIDQPPPKEKPVMLPSASSPIEGISDVGNALAHCNETGGYKDEGLGVFATGTKPTARRNRAISPRDEQSSNGPTAPKRPSLEETMSNSDTAIPQNRELNMTGFKASYDLPVHGGGNE